MSAAPNPGGPLARFASWVVGEIIVRLCVVALLAWMTLPRFTRRRPTA